MMGTEILKIDASRAELFTKNKCANLNDPNCRSAGKFNYSTYVMVSPELWVEERRSRLAA